MNRQFKQLDIIIMLFISHQLRHNNHWSQVRYGKVRSLANGRRSSSDEIKRVKKDKESEGKPKEEEGSMRPMNESTMAKPQWQQTTM